MSEICQNCRNEVMTNWDYCHFCGIARSEYAKSREKTVRCLNKKCTASNPINSNYCGVCGIAISEYAKMTQKEVKSKWRQKSELLEQVLSESNDKNKEQEKKLTEAKKQLTETINKIEEIENNKEDKTIPQWISIFFSIVGIVFLISLIFLSNCNAK
jgi:vacuolar-type H+-ATPase subunit I/STV1